MDDWDFNRIAELPLEGIDERLQRYRLQMPRAEQAMAQSLQRYGQVSPIVVCWHDQAHVLIDGFKRVRAARVLKGMSSLHARSLPVDEQGAKAAIYHLNRIGQSPQVLEEAWIVHALVREDGLSQVEAATLLGRHKSWVNRRLALLEQLCDEAREEVKLGLLTPAIARQLTRLPQGNQQAALQTARESSLTSHELAQVVDLLQASSTREQTDFVLSDPRRALRQSQQHPVHTWDPRMSPHGNRIAKQLTFLLDHLAKMHTWLEYRGRGELMAYDREVLLPGLERLIGETTVVAESATDFVGELKQA